MIGWLDPSIETANTGDYIIAQAIAEELSRLGVDRPTRLPTRRAWSIDELRAGANCNVFIVGGTNLLSSHPLIYRQWHIGRRELQVLRGRVVLLGVGWWQYQSRPDFTARALANRLLNPNALHSVRDSYTVAQLAKVRGHFIDTTCPTLWRVPSRGTTQHGFRATIVSTVTDYLRNPARDRLLLQKLDRRSERLLVWPQGSGDRAYVSSLGFGDRCIPEGLSALDEALSTGDVEYVGTRLHAGIRALTHGTPAVIVSIDNRAREIAAGTNLWTIAREDLENLDTQLDGFESWSLELPVSAITAWCESFSSLLEGLSP